MTITYKILVVDDEEAIRTLVATSFTRYGHHCETAKDGMEALEKVAHDSFDAVVTDVIMPRMDGFTFTKELVKLYPDLPIMAMTGHDCEEYAEQAIAAGAREFINKSFSMHEFVVRFDKMMRDHREREAMLTLSLTDELTGLHNRRRFFVLTEQCLKVAARAKRRALLLFIDVDDLKGINDRHGHGAGDRALIDLANILKTTFRASDIIGRFGGDEFVVLLECADERSDILITRLHKNLEDYNAKAPQSQRLSISVGKALFDPERPVSIDELLTKADTLMYGEKRRRGDRTPLNQ
jgi:diguanylate cyclase (GGDEF)-like protein